jgi:outer membrane protein assembly factor BamB
MRRFRMAYFLGLAGLVGVLAGCGSTVTVSTPGGTATASTASTATPGSTQTVAYIDALSNSTELQLSDGSVAHTFAGGAHGLLSPIVNGRVYVAFDAPMVPETTVRTVWAVDAQTGATVWTHLTGPGYSSAPVVGNGVVYVSSDQGDIFALDAATGAERWHHAVTIGTTTVPFLGKTALDATTVYQLAPDHVYAYDAVTGTLRWTSATGGNAIAVAGSSVLVEHTQDALYAFAAATGTQQWRQAASHADNGPATPLVVAGDSVYVSSDGKHIVKAHLTDGSVAATITADDYITTMTADATNLYVATIASLHAYNLSDSAVHWSVSLATAVNLAAANGTLLALTWDGASHATTGGTYMTALRGSDGGQNWRTHVTGLPGYGLVIGALP